MKGKPPVIVVLFVLTERSIYLAECFGLQLAPLQLRRLGRRASIGEPL